MCQPQTGTCHLPLQGLNHVHSASSSDGKESACDAGDLGLIAELEGSLEKGMATHSYILAWRIPWIEKLGRLLSMGSIKSRTLLSD